MTLTPEEAQKIEDGKQAEGLLANPLLQDALAALTVRAIDGFASTAVTDTEALVNHRRMLAVIQEFKTSLFDLVMKGKSAADTARHREMAEERDKRMARFK